MSKPTLLASAPSPEALEKSIALYWCTTADRIDVNRQTGEVLQGGKLMTGVRARQVAGRWRFERVST